MPLPIEERDARIQSRFLEQGHTAQRIAIDEGLSLVRVEQILKPVRGKPRAIAAEGEQSLSPRHVRIGRKLSKHRQLVLGVDRPFLADKLKWSSVKVSYVEKGTHNLTLVDLEQIAKILQIKLWELLESTEIDDPIVEINPKGEIKSS